MKMKNTITFDYLCDFFEDAYINKNRQIAKQFFNDHEMVEVAKGCYPMLDISWDNRCKIAYLFRNRMTSPPECENPDCNNIASFHRSKFVSYCSYTCSGKIINNKQDKKDKIKNIYMERYGVENPMHLKEVKDKFKQTNLERYGVENPMHSEEVKDKIKQTNLERYGVEYGFSSDDVKNKIKQTNLARYGCENPTQNEAVRDKVKKTNLERRGVEYTWNDKTVKNKKIQTNLKKYGSEFHNRSHFNIQYIDLFSNPKLFETLLYKHGTYELAELVNCDISSIYNVVKKYNIVLPPRPRSVQEQKLIDLFETNNINYICNDRSIIVPYELDFYLPDYNIAIEINGVYWHSEKFKDKNYHYNKWKLCRDKGITLYSIFEDDFSDIWINKILYLVKKSTYDKIHGRKCKVVVIDGMTTKKFLEANHLQGNKYSSINLGLYYSDELVSLMSFSNTRNNNGGIIELTRFCNRKDKQVIGGASKLLSHFIKTYGNRYSEIISFSDNTYSDGGIYVTLGFELESNLNIDYKYVVNGKREHKANYRKSQIQKKFNIDPEFVKSNTEKEIMDMLGVSRIWDCGKKKWSLKLL